MRSGSSVLNYLNKLLSNKIWENDSAVVLTQRVCPFRFKASNRVILSVNRSRSLPLFLDEIGDIALTVQNKLLRAIEEKQIKRLGTNRHVLCDVQIIAATSRNLASMIQSREFREDLHCRLAVLTIETVPLRNRREDIPAMIAFYLREAAAAPNRTNQCEPYWIEEDAG